MNLDTRGRNSWIGKRDKGTNQNLLLERAI